MELLFRNNTARDTKKRHIWPRSVNTMSILIAKYFFFFNVHKPKMESLVCVEFPEIDTSHFRLRRKNLDICLKKCAWIIIAFQKQTQFLPYLNKFGTTKYTKKLNMIFILWLLLRIGYSQLHKMKKTLNQLTIILFKRRTKCKLIIVLPFHFRGPAVQCSKYC